MMILLRTMSLSPRTADFARRLAGETGSEVCCVVDERQSVVDTGDFAKISLSRASCEQLGLYCPVDFGWRCGDYGFYFARRRFPDERWFWLIEYDVRLGGVDLADFFARYAAEDSVDMIAGHYRRVDKPWYWTHTMAARDMPVWRCLFPVVRLSAAAIDVLYEQRIAYGRRWLRRANWPNDESFVATVLSRAGMRCADLNDFGGALYDDSTYSHAQPIDGNQLDERASPSKVFHPVLFDDDLRRKLELMAWYDKGEKLPHRIKRRLLGAVNVRLPA